MTQTQPLKVPAAKPKPHVHEWPEHWTYPEPVCACGAKLVVVEPGPVMENCYWGVIGHPGHVSNLGTFGYCTRKIIKGSEPPYCLEHQEQKKVIDALAALKGRMIREVSISDSEFRITSESDTDSRVDVFDVLVQDGYDGGTDYEWTARQR